MSDTTYCPWNKICYEIFREVHSMNLCRRQKADENIAYFLACGQQPPTDLISPCYLITTVQMREFLTSKIKIEKDDVLKKYSVYENRLHTFQSKWPLRFITPARMARAGFFYTGIRDKVACSYCLIEIQLWERADDPEIEHRRHSPECTFFVKSLRDGGGVCGDSQNIEVNIPYKNLKKELQFLVDKFMGRYFVQRKYEFPGVKLAYASKESRHASFFKYENYVAKNAAKLAASGLYYMGNGKKDKTRCFCCQQGFILWNNSDDSWTEHARWSPHCTFLLLTKDQDFVLDVHEKIRMNNISETNDTKCFRRFYPTNTTDDIYIDDSDGLPSGFPDLFGPTASNTSATQCKMCFRHKIKVMLIPCGHAVACIDCAATLINCPICRKYIHSMMKVLISENIEKEIQPTQLVGNAAQSADEDDTVLCRDCRIVPANIVFIPCRHVYLCFGCAKRVKKCRECMAPYFAMFQIFL